MAAAPAPVPDAREKVRAFAFELGFDACRFTDAAPPSRASALDRWLESGAHGEMAWIQRNAPKRRDPALVLPGAQSVIVLAASYFNDSIENSRSNRGSTKIGRAHV